jgi:hypothetical protein
MEKVQNDRMATIVGGADSVRRLSLDKDSAHKTHLCDKINTQRITDD